MEDEHEIIVAACLCKKNVFSTSVPKSTLPLKTRICHCEQCRRVSGNLGWSGVEWPASRVPDFDGLSRTDFSPRSWAYFCPTCGCFMFWYRHAEPTRLSVSVAVLDKPDQIVQLTGHIFIGDTVDGGAADFIPTIEGRDLPRWREQDDSKDPNDLLPLPWKDDAVIEASRASSSDGETLRASCLCKGVEFVITRPDTVEDGRVTKGEEWWQTSGNRFPAGCCVCESCRLASGSEVNHWAFVPKANVKHLDGSDFSYSIGALKTFRSSKEAQRCFCGNCGATVFYAADARPGLLDVAIGLLSAPTGCRAEEWLVWRTSRISWENAAIHTHLRDALVSGLKAWGEKQPESSTQKFGPDLEFRTFQKLLAATGSDQ